MLIHMKIRSRAIYSFNMSWYGEYNEKHKNATQSEQLKNLIGKIVLTGKIYTLNAHNETAHSASLVNTL